MSSFKVGFPLLLHTTQVLISSVSDTKSIPSLIHSFFRPFIQLQFNPFLELVVSVPRTEIITGDVSVLPPLPLPLFILDPNLSTELNVSFTVFRLPSSGPSSGLVGVEGSGWLGTGGKREVGRRTISTRVRVWGLLECEVDKTASCVTGVDG